jgi:hypothetical protein
VNEQPDPKRYVYIDINAALSALHDAKRAAWLGNDPSGQLAKARDAVARALVRLSGS